MLYLRIFVFGSEYSFRFIEQERSSAALCGPPISLEAEVNYPYWLATEVQVSQSVGRSNPQPPNLVAHSFRFKDVET